MKGHSFTINRGPYPLLCSFDRDLFHYSAEMLELIFVPEKAQLGPLCINPSSVVTLDAFGSCATSNESLASKGRNIMSGE